MTFEEAKQRVQLAIATLEKRGHGGLTLDELKGVYGAMCGEKLSGFAAWAARDASPFPTEPAPPTATELPDE